METLAFGLVHHLGNALFHSAIHIAGHETFHHIKHKYFHHHCMANHDVARALNESYIAALTVLERQYGDENKDKALRDLAKKAFERMRSLASTYFPTEGHAGAITDVEASRFTEDRAAPALIEEALIRQDPPMPPSMIELFRNCFCDVFICAFKEIGIKNNEKVRAVLTHAILTELRHGMQEQRMQTQEIKVDLNHILAALAEQAEFRRAEGLFFQHMGKVLHGVSRNLTAVREDQEVVKGLVQKIADQVLAPKDAELYLVSHDQAGCALARYPVGDRALSIGRGSENTVQLPDSSVSTRHAELTRQGQSLVLRDLGSRNGTFVDDGTEKIRQVVVKPGQIIRIGRYWLSFETSEKAEARPFFQTIQSDEPMS